jgi:ribonuclease HI
LNLDATSNNLAKGYALLRGIQLAKETRRRPLIVLGDSFIAIKAMIGDSIQVKYKLSMVLTKVREEVKTLGKVSYYHVKS